jgi:uncharacterized protein YuzE
MSDSDAIDAAALRVRYDAEADAMYLRLRDGSVAETVEIEEMVYVDIDEEGHPLGIEFVVASDFLPFLSRRGGEFSVPRRIEPVEAGVVR